MVFAAGAITYALMLCPEIARGPADCVAVGFHLSRGVCRMIAQDAQVGYDRRRLTDGVDAAVYVCTPVDEFAAKEWPEHDDN